MSVSVSGKRLGNARPHLSSSLVIRLRPCMTRAHRPSTKQEDLSGCTNDRLGIHIHIKIVFIYTSGPWYIDTTGGSYIPGTYCRAEQTNSVERYQVYLSPPLLRRLGSNGHILVIRLSLGRRLVNLLPVAQRTNAFTFFNRSVRNPLRTAYPRTLKTWRRAIDAVGIRHHLDYGHEVLLLRTAEEKKHDVSSARRSEWRL